MWKEFEARVCTIVSCCNDLSSVPEWQVLEFRVDRVWLECWRSMQCNALPMGILETFTFYVFV